MKIKNPANYNTFAKRYEINTQPSMTLPDQTMSIRTILERHSRGLSIEGVKVPIWNGEDDDLPDIRTLDLAERQELIEKYKDELSSIKKRQFNKIDKIDENKDNVRVDAIESNSGEPSSDF